MKPIAVEKAESLHKFAKSQGAQLSTFMLILSDKEAMELLEWFKSTMYRADVVFDLDLEIAHRTGNPWEMLPNFQLMGFEIGRASDLH